MTNVYVYVMAGDRLVSVFPGLSLFENRKSGVSGSPSSQGDLDCWLPFEASTSVRVHDIAITPKVCAAVCAALSSIHPAPQEAVTVLTSIPIAQCCGSRISRKWDQSMFLCLASFTRRNVLENHPRVAYVVCQLSLLTAVTSVTPMCLSIHLPTGTVLAFSF